MMGEEAKGMGSRGTGSNARDASVGERRPDAGQL